MAPLLWWGCAPRSERTTVESAGSPVVQTAPAQRVGNAQVASVEHGQPQPMQSSPAEPDRNAAAAGAQPAEGAGRSASTRPAASAPAVAAALSEGTGAHTEPAQQSKTEASGTAAPAGAAPPNEATAPPTEPAQQAKTEAAGTAAPAGATDAAGGSEPATTIDQRVAAAQKRIARLEQQLALEVQRRRDVEGEMKRLLQETSAGPFERADDVVEKHLREELDRARKEVGQLRAALATERREHDEVERAYAALQAQVQAGAHAAPGGASSEEIEALKERQRRVLASIQQDLEASRQREAALRQSVEQLQGGGAASLSDAMITLRSQNSALQMRLEEEHQRNRDLTAKLHLAMRVTDLIFRMRQSAEPQAVAVAQPAAAR
jgi:hypothetical protein